jgi:arylsulfatase A-like enzyme
MTGRHTFRYGLQNVVRPWAEYGLPVEERTLANALHDAGYYTAITGKWHLGEVEKKYLPLQRGFDYHYGCYRGAIDYYDHTASGVGGLDWHRNGKPLREEGYSTDLTASDAVKVIQNHDTNKPLARKEIPLYSIPDMGAIRAGDWKLVRYHTPNMVAAVEQPRQSANLEIKTELFNLADDPNEKNNLAESNPEKLKELLERLDVYSKQAVTPLGSKPKSPDFKPKEIWGYFD